MTTNGFGYVKIEDGLICCYMGDSRNPNIHKFENNDIVNSVIMVRELLGVDYRINRDVEALKKAILEDKLELIRLRKAIDDKIQNLHDQIEVAEREDYADITDYCMKERISDLEEIKNGTTDLVL